ncbi:hypothetical protein Egran_01090 [Elaphomyces granulatus]|uniref:Uncharacterized protein n=1 Tax=Elaphomyces granulatus TaxID=519963 RepID=A0A232M438_9EURO|nr:hypothetical protein Egran_01090 [Elaphomyces granulatus]
MDDPEHLRDVADADHGPRQYIEHIERSKAISLSYPFVQVYESANIEGLDRVTGKSTSPHRAVFFSSSNLASHPDANKLPSVNPSLDLRLPSLSNGSTAQSTPSYTAGCQTERKEDWERHKDHYLLQKFLSLDKYRERSVNNHKSEASWSDIESVKQSIIENVLRNIGVDPQIDNYGLLGIGALHESGIHSFFDQISYPFWREHASQTRATTNESSSSKSASLRTLQDSAFGGQKIQKKQHNRHKGREEDSEDEDLDGIKHGKNSQALLAADKEFACPYYKSNPDGPHQKRCERGSWKTIAKLKHVRKLSSFLLSRLKSNQPPNRLQEHLQRHHKVQASTINEEALQRVFDKYNITPAEKWGAIYFVLFPQASVIPCPYYGIDWSIDTSGSSNIGSSSPGIPCNLSSSADEVLPSNLNPLDIFPALVTKIRCMLQEEEKLHWDRIHTKLSEVVSETYLNFGSKINEASTDDMRHMPDTFQSTTLVCPAGPSAGTIDNPVGDMGSEASSNVVSLPGHQIIVGSPEDSQRPCLPVLEESTRALFKDPSNERRP